MKLNSRRVWGTVLFAAAFLLLASISASAHPSPDDFSGISRSQLGLIISFVVLAVSGILYIWYGLRGSSRAETVRDFFFYNKKVSPTEYFDTTVGYSFQVVVTIYFIFWGFKYGIGVFYYALTWLFGFLLFQWCSKKLVVFALSDHTLHSFLAERYGVSLSIRRLTAFCTLFGLIGALLVEVNYTTDILTSLTNTPVPPAAWIFVFVSILAVTWLFVQHGGFKATVITDVLQLPTTYVALAILLAFLNWLNFQAGHRYEGFVIGILCSAMWAVVILARSRNHIRLALRDKANLAAIFGLVISSLTMVVCSTAYKGLQQANEPIPDLPYAFSLAGLGQQGFLTLLGFTILNFSWQFFDMTAWQRISSLDLSNLSDKDRAVRISCLIGETKYESPITWVVGIVIGIALHYSGMFHMGADADTAFTQFIKKLFDNDWPQPLGMIASYVALPALLVGFVGIMLTTVDSFLVTSTFTWIHDISLADSKENLNQTVVESKVLKRVRRATLILLALSTVAFIVFAKIFNANIFLLLNTIYSAQFAITFFTLGALFLKNPKKHRVTAIITVVMALIANYGTAIYCYQKMVYFPNSSWPDYFYVLPTIISALVGCFVVVLGWLWWLWELWGTKK